MSDDHFDAGWLRLREPADHRARDEALTEAVAREGDARRWSRVLDLGAGTGSNLRYLDPRIGWIRHWTLVDHDPVLLVRVTDPEPDRTLIRVRGGLEAEGLDRVAGSDLITASALLDLVSGAWVRRLVDACRATGAAGLFTLTYDGTVRWARTDPGDARLLEAVNAHQVGDKGLGTALGPAATRAAAEAFDAAGYRTRTASTPWRLRGPRDAELALALVQGWVSAAREVDPGHEGAFEDWRARRVEAVARGDFQLEVGHRDLLALPPDVVP